jgi:hypothetical protein
MNTEHLLRATYGKKEFAIDLDIVENIGGFQTGKDDCSPTSLALTLNYHQPIKKYSFDAKKFENWCEKNNFLCHIDEVFRIVRLRRKR